MGIIITYYFILSTFSKEIKKKKTKIIPHPLSNLFYIKSLPDSNQYPNINVFIS
jgi:hypothetical protein